MINKAKKRFNRESQIDWIARKKPNEKPTSSLKSQSKNKNNINTK
jgi:hypothetical protein